MRNLALVILAAAFLALAFTPTGDPAAPVRWGLVLLAVVLAIAAGVLLSGARYTTPVGRR